MHDTSLSKYNHWGSLFDVFYCIDFSTIQCIYNCTYFTKMVHFALV